MSFLKSPKMGLKSQSTLRRETDEIKIWPLLRGTGISNRVADLLSGVSWMKTMWCRWLLVTSRCEVPITVGPLLRGSVPNDLSPPAKYKKNLTPLIKGVCKSPLSAMHRLQPGITCDALYPMIATTCCQANKTIPLVHGINLSLYC